MQRSNVVANQRWTTRDVTSRPPMLASSESSGSSIVPRLKSRHQIYYALLSIPIVLFLVSLYIPPTMVPDSGVGFLALRSMLEDGAFNSVQTPDPANIAMGCGHCVRALQFEKLYRVCVLAGAGQLL
jgi:hypothetical protein